MAFTFMVLPQPFLLKRAPRGPICEACWTHVSQRLMTGPKRMAQDIGAGSFDTKRCSRSGLACAAASVFLTKPNTSCTIVRQRRYAPIVFGIIPD